jgi:NADPH:quinone reductase-like Zn-dependent oxidoreductase
MKALDYRKKDKAQKYQLEEIEKPIAKDNEVLVRIYSASINAADYRSIQLGITPKKKIFGSLISGTVESIGKNITKYKIGDEVIGELSDNRFSGLAE